jgi:methanogenic corrinoid protein MtbC1
MELKEELFSKLSEYVKGYDEENVSKTAQEIVEAGFDPLEAILEGLCKGILQAGDLFNQKEYYVPELLLCADALDAGMQILKPLVKEGKAADEKGTIVLGTVQGDVHDIGKNLVKLMLEVSGYSVVDLGVDVPLEKFVTEQKRTSARVVGLSAMLTTSLKAMKKAVSMLKEQDPKVQVLVGGAPLSPSVAKLFGADGYAKNVSDVVEETQRLMELAVT